jgi:hypothetical protein
VIRTAFSLIIGEAQGPKRSELLAQELGKGVAGDHP